MNLDEFFTSTVHKIKHVEAKGVVDAIQAQRSQHRS
jgi:hypothetical protein